VPLCVLEGLPPSQSRLKPSFSTDIFNHLLYCCKSISSPEREHEASAPPATTAVRRSLPATAIADCRESCTQTPSCHWCHSCTRVSKARFPDRGSCGMLGSRYDSVRRRRASVRGSPLNIGSDTSQPRCLGRGVARAHTARYAGRDR
jgi:hypothetical protein